MDQIESCVPPGFRFHPTEEELVGFYLKRKINSLKFDLDVISDIDLYRIEPWDIQEKCKLGCNEEKEWYFFSHKDRKYPTGSRTNRATAAGFWKATGRDKAVLSNKKMIGMRKTLVFYKGRAPNGKKSDWIMHEYRLQTNDLAPPQEEGWVVCRAFKKPSPSHKQGFVAWNQHNYYNYYMRNSNYNSHNSIMDSPLSVQSIPSPTDLPDSSHQATNSFPPQPDQMQAFANCEQAYISNSGVNLMENSLMFDLPQLDSPSLSTSLVTKEPFDHQSGVINNEDYDHHERSSNSSNNKWDILDTLLGSQMPESTSLLLPDHDYDLKADDQNQMESFLGCFL